MRSAVSWFDSFWRLQDIACTEENGERVVGPATKTEKLDAIVRMAQRGNPYTVQLLREDLPEEDVSNGCSITLATSHNRSKKPTLMPSLAMICYGKRAYINTWKNS